jgi:uncharacterized membrane protein
MLGPPTARPPQRVHGRTAWRILGPVGEVEPGRGHRAGEAAPDDAPASEGVVGESRWPMAIAVLVLMGATVAAPARASLLGPGLAVAEGVLLAALVIGDPGRIDRRTRWLRRASLLLIALLVGASLLFTGLLIFDLVTGSAITSNAALLLATGAKVWLANNIAFALLYWQLDGGGPEQRAHGLPAYPALGFPQLLSPGLAPPDWRPQFHDYLYLALTTANAFSPTDTPPLATWSKVAMGTQALISFVIVGLVIARAVNIFK